MKGHDQREDRVPPAGTAGRGAEKIRAFVAIPLPGFLRKNLARIRVATQRQYGARDVKWTDSAQAHLTLFFMPALDAARVDELAGALRQVCAMSAPLRLRAAETGAFPSAERPRVIWAGLDGDLEKLGALQDGVAQACAAFVEKAGAQKFIPHLTLARCEPRAGRALFAAFQRDPPLDTTAWNATEILLMRSVLNRRGATHTVIARLPLGVEARADERRRHARTMRS